MNRRLFLLYTTAGIIECRSSFAHIGEKYTAELGKNEDRKLGICIYSLRNQLRVSRQTQKRENSLANPIVFLRHCHKLGAGGIQMPLGIRTSDEASNIRKEAERLEMFIEGIVNLPRETAEIDRFASQLRTIRMIGADTARIVTMPGRRYEQFNSYQQFQSRLKQSLETLRMIEPVAVREGIRLAIENHKDRTLPEFLKLLDKFESEYIGICFDTGNNLALMEDPAEVARALADRTFTVHLKDQAVCPYDEGFLLADVSLGRGVIELEQIVRILRNTNPSVRFNLELITRDPIKVPVLTEQYWETLPDIPARNLARTLRMVRQQGCCSLCQPIEQLPLARQCEFEEQSIRQSFKYAMSLL